MHVRYGGSDGGEESNGDKGGTLQVSHAHAHKHDSLKPRQSLAWWLAYPP
jgi:hypothetical protein